MTLSERQEKAILLIKKMEAEFGQRWFVLEELTGITLHTTKALVEKGYLDAKTFDEITYYISTW